MTIEQFIIDLLKRHNCVVVPNFGGFIANYQPAVIDEISKTITPPSKQLIFNSNLLKNDGLLANYIVDKKAITYPESLIEIENKANEWKAALNENKRLAFGEIGFLYEQDGAIVFEQNRETNLWLKAYGLSSIQFVAAHSVAEEKKATVIVSPAEIKESKEAKTALQFSKSESPEIELSENENIEEIKGEVDSKIIPLVQEKKSKRKWGYIAVACAIPFLFYTYWIPMETNFLETGNIKLSDFNPFSRNKVVATYKHRNQELTTEAIAQSKTIKERVAALSGEVEVYAYEFGESTYIPVKVEKPIDELPDNTEINVAEAIQAPIQLITGCFSVESNANNLVAELQSMGYQAYVLDKNKGLYRVAVKGFQDMKTAKIAKRDLKSKNYSSWILKK
ncbi:MAG: SPOR domain-containing protein [Crocinitomicaceae bacterium]